MDLFSSLFTYRERETRSPVEDFLTELLCGFLKVCDLTGHTRYALKALFKLPDANSARLNWTTQEVIPAGFGAASGKRPDLVGNGTLDGEDCVIVVENKIWASFTAHVVENEVWHQLRLYEQYLKVHPARRKNVVLLTHGTTAPPDWGGTALYWWDVRDALQQMCSEVGLPDQLKWYAGEFALFLGEQGMGPIHISLEQIASMRPYRAFLAACEALSTHIWVSLEEHPAYATLQHAGLQSARGYGAFKELSGALLTPSGKAAENSSLIFWCGILRGPAYEVDLNTADVPELTAGFAVWDPLNVDEAHEWLERMRDVLNAGTSSHDPWHVNVKQYTEKRQQHHLVTLRASQSMLSVFDAADCAVPVRHFVRQRLDEIKSLPNDLLSSLMKYQGQADSKTS